MIKQFDNYQDTLVSEADNARFATGRLFVLAGLCVLVVACGGGGGGGTSTSAATQAALDVAANTDALAKLAAAPIPTADIWKQLDGSQAAITDPSKIAQLTLAVPSSTAIPVTIASFEVITDPTVKAPNTGTSMSVFKEVLATGTMDIATRLVTVTLVSGKVMPSTGSVWVSVAGEDFASSQDSGGALELAVTDINKALPLPPP